MSKKTLENTKGVIQMDNPEKLATRRRKTKQKHNTICVGHHYIQKHKERK